MDLKARIQAKMLGTKPVPLENLCDLPNSLGYDRVAGTIRGLHGVADDLNVRVDVLEAAVRSSIEAIKRGSALNALAILEGVLPHQ